MAKKQTDDLIDAGSEYSFPASDPPSFMGGAAIAGPPPEDGEAPHEHVVTAITDTEEVKPTHEGNTHQRIRSRAYEIWEQEGRMGEAEEHWLRAEREISGLPEAEQTQRTGDSSSQPASDAEKMAEQIQVALDARNARSKQSKRAGTGGKKEGPKKSGSSKRSM